MSEFDVKNIRNVCLVSHSGAGKTSLAEAMLFTSKMTTRQGKVGEGNTTADYNPDEIERKISISAKPLYCNWKNNRIYMMDTPGYADFVGDVMASLAAVDAGIVIIDATGGIEVGTERVWGMLEKKNMPRLIFINKLDKDNTDFYKLVEDIQKRFGTKCAPLALPVGKAGGLSKVVSLLSGDLASLADQKDKAEELKLSLTESVSESDDALLEKYLNEGKISEDEMKQGLEKGIKSGSVIPILCGSAESNIGVDVLLDTIIDVLPDPSAKPITVTAGTEEKQINADAGAPFAAFVFKSISDPYVGQLSLFRVLSGTLKSNGNIYNATKKSKEHVGQIYLLQGKNQVPVDTATAGDIAALAKLKEVSTNDTLCDDKNQVLVKPTVFPESAFSVSVKPHSKNDEEKIMGALQKLNVEDPTFKFNRDTQTKELIVSGMGDLHLDIMMQRLRDKFKVGVDIGTPKVPYKETIKSSVKVQGKYKKQSGGRGQYGDCWLEVEPMESGAGFEFVDKIVGGSIPRNYIPSVEKGVRAAMAEGILTGCPVVDVKVTVYDGSYHTVDSSDMAFQIAGSMAFKKAQEQATPVLLEPVMLVEVAVPSEFMGQINGDLSSRRGRVLGMESGASMDKVKAMVPLSEMFTYASELKSLTGGRGSYTMQFDHYDEVPGRIAQQIIEKAKKEGSQEVNQH